MPPLDREVVVKGFEVRVNGALRGTPHVRVIATALLGVMTLTAALRAAMEAGLDLVEADPATDPPVCKLLDFSRCEEKARPNEAKRPTETAAAAMQRAFQIRVNSAVRAPRVRVIGVDGEMLGVMTRGDALRAAIDAGLDLVEVNPKAERPVCKILDFGAYKLQEKKKAAADAKHPPDPTAPNDDE